MDGENFFTQQLNELRGEERYRVFADLERRYGSFRAIIITALGKI